MRASTCECRKFVSERFLEKCTFLSKYPLEKCQFMVKNSLEKCNFSPFFLLQHEQTEDVIYKFQPV